MSTQTSRLGAEVLTGRSSIVKYAGPTRPARGVMQHPHGGRGQAMLAFTWVDEDGVAHKVAQPNASTTGDQVVATGYRRAAPLAPTQIDGILSKPEETMFSGSALTPDAPEARAHHEDHPPPIEILHGDPRTRGGLAQRIAQVEAWWRLDAVLALQDYVD